MTRPRANDGDTRGTASGYVAVGIAGTAAVVAVVLLAVIGVCLLYLIACAASAT